MQALLFSRLIATLRFFLKSFYFFLNRIARYAQSKELEIFLRKFRKSPAKQFLEIAYNKKSVALRCVALQEGGMFFLFFSLWTKV